MTRITGVIVTPTATAATTHPRDDRRDAEDLFAGTIHAQRVPARFWKESVAVEGYGIRLVGRPACIAELGGFRPPEDPLASWFGHVLVARPGEGWRHDQPRADARRRSDQPG